ncbi:MAG: glucose-6-phosphate dehydrogenase [Deltaproteobacteria bacterium]|jgi:glucose-6-phosphate 1-dehydrogenase|nr:glucose-6-phosphate dehydrogenase [Deltaproteobacteria bacterium]MBT6436213.1 glucose-6-phosphate dehydrogenase [Deltaproteobacteria bacterium]MBT6491633.1 glucose-6-phosphate dehydrogenase [Deltaproteobacteria bacterium]
MLVDSEISQDFDMVIFGGTGDLALKKLLPALFYCELDKRLGDGRILCVSRTQLTRDDYVAQIKPALKESLGEHYDSAAWQRFEDRLEYVLVDVTIAETFASLKALLAGSGTAQRPRIYYFAMAPGLFGVLANNLSEAGLVCDQCRVVLEKPLGHDLASSRAINDQIADVFEERQVFRIDHYLGKETVQNLLALRFANSLFEPLWSASHIDHVQITVAEKIGVEGRWSYYDESGALRDMVQNHLLQLLCLVAMEPPASLDPDAVRDEKLKVLRALEPLTGDNSKNFTVRGQYRAGAIDGLPVPGYLEEDDSRDESIRETFVAIRTEINNWRWSGVPFYLRTGKRLPRRVSEIVIQFKEVPHWLFRADVGTRRGNQLIIRLQPDEGVQLSIQNKVPGAGPFKLKQAPLNLSFADAFEGRQPYAYERLLLDVIKGKSTLFMRRDEVDMAWTWIDGLLNAWADDPSKPKAYTSGSWGPSAAVALIERDGRTWNEESGD